MIISHKSKYIFVHIPKTGGISIEHQFNDSDAMVYTCRGVSWSISDKLKHASCAHIKRMVGVQAYNEYYKWAIVRNPFDRVISAWWHALQIRKYENITFRQFITADNTYRWLKDNQYDMVHIDGVLNCDVYRYEIGLDEIVKKVSVIINQNDPTFPLMDKLVKFEKSGYRKDRRHYRDVIDTECRKYIEQMYKKDLEAFGYEW